ncbi:hypothetical protein E0H73_01835 [Kribbella pittospori]|uniref:Uncharacterized protein n=1 Tax=Kribbella pittospori TaxID=722689 RepID=A0A4R0KYE1_9ACTN|nr:hypothetical protein [Kribbella pittospori]TCC65700.1 hypothetical protein E0H73_01835 [Kribbella pittospori]
MPEAIWRAHERALAGHIASEETHNDAYGNGLAVFQHEELLNLAEQVPGLRTAKGNQGKSRFELLVVAETSVALWPLRFATDHKTGHANARIRSVSDYRRGLLTLAAPSYGRNPQLTFDDIEVDEAEIEAAQAEEDALLEQLRRFGSVVTIGFSCNPAGMFELGWGDCELIDEDSRQIYWPHWESLSRPGPDAGYGGLRVPLKPVDGPGSTRFDDGAPSDEDFGLTVRSPLAGEPSSEAGPPEQEVGSDDEPQ